MAELAHNARIPVDGLAIPALASKPHRLTALQRLICAVAALGFAFDLYEMVVLSVVVRPALVTVGGLRPGTPEFNLWVGLLFSVPAVTGGCFGLLGGYLTDIFGRKSIRPVSTLLPRPACDTREV